MVDWEGAELCYYVNGESHEIALSDAQFAIVTKILGLETHPDGTMYCFSDDVLKQFTTMKGNPLRLERK